MLQTPAAVGGRMLEIKAWSMPPHPPPPQAECLSFEWDEKQAYMHQCQHDSRTNSNTPTAMENLYLWQNSVSASRKLASDKILQKLHLLYSKVEDYETGEETCVDTVQMRENGGSLNFNFISIPNPAVAENWVCWHRLQQLIFGKWCCVHCFDLFKLFSKSHIYVSTLCVCKERLFLILFSSTHQLHSGYCIILALCALGFAVCIFQTTDAKCVIFCVGWHKSLKLKTAPPLYKLQF